MENSHTAAKKGSFGRYAMIVAIVIVMNLFFNYAISLVYKAPVYESYVTDTSYTQPADDAAYTAKLNAEEAQYTGADQAYSRNVFIILVVLGVLTILLGTLMTSSILALAFSWAGVLSLFIASTRYWEEANSIVKVIVLAIALGALIWVALKKMEK